MWVSNSFTIACLVVVPLAYDALGSPSDAAKQFLDLVGDRIGEGRREHLFNTLTLLLSVALANNTAAILLDRSEAALLGEFAYDDFDVLEWTEYCAYEWASVDGMMQGAFDPLTGEWQ